MNGMVYDKGKLVISDGTCKMRFSCDDEFASHILESIKEAVNNPIKSGGFLNDKDVSNDRDAVIESLYQDGYVYVGDTDGISLFVAYPGLDFGDRSLIIFRYVSHALPNKNGSVQVNIPMKVQ